jgi:simple sugar transport system permease protein
VNARVEARPLAGAWRVFEARSIGILGIGLGVLAFWLALPPLKTRTEALPIAIGILAVAAGIWAVVRKEHRVGWGAVVSGLAGIVLGVLATTASTTHLSTVFVWSALVAATLAYATPLTYAAIGGMVSERSGVVNIGLEGMMLMGAFFAVWGSDATGSWVLGILIGMAAGGALALVHAFFAIHLRADQIVTGTAINFLALGITGYGYVQKYGEQGTPANLRVIPNVHLGFLDGVYFLGPAFGKLNLMIWLSFAVLVLSYLVMFRTPLGLRIRSVGEHPKAADTVGISVYGIRYAAVTLSGVIAALGGAYLAIGYTHSFTENMTAGRGFIGLAALIFGNWRPFGAFAAALLFGFAGALAPFLQVYGYSAGVLVQALPYVLTLIAVAGVIGRSIPPAAVGRPYVKQ